MGFAWGNDYVSYARSRAPQYLVGTFLILVAVAGELAIPGVIGRLLDEYPHFQSQEALKMLGLALGVRALGMAAGRWIFAREGLGGLLWLRSKQRDEAFRDRSWSKDLTPGEWVQRLGSDARGAAHLFGNSWLGGTNLGFMLILSFWGLVSVSPIPALVITLSWPCLFFCLFQYTRNERKALEGSREAMRVFSSSLAYALRWLRQLKLLDGAERSSRELLSQADEVTKKGWEARFRALKGEFLGFLMASVSSSIALIWLVNEAQSGRITLGSLIAFLSYLTLGTGAVAQLPGFLSGLRWARVCFDQCKKGSLESPHIGVRPTATGLHKPIILQCEAFALSNWNQTFDLSLVEGESLAVLGTSGSGKTTLLKVWCGAPLPYSGRLSFKAAGRGLLDLENAVYVPQWPAIFSGTVRENLLAQNVPDPDLWKSLVKVELAEEFRMGDQGLETVLGEGGAGLSTGQKQRLALARALLRNPSVLVLDDCLSGVDFSRGKRIVGRVQEQLRGRTLIFSGQREWWLGSCSRQVILPLPSRGVAQ